mgnify:CR=1 FL=1
MLAVSHLASNSDMPSIFLFGGFLVYAIVWVLAAERRETNKPVSDAKATYDVLAVGLGVALTFFYIRSPRLFSGVDLG